VFTAAMAGITIGEQDLFRRLLGKIGPGMLVLADRNFLGHPLWAAADTTPVSYAKPTTPRSPPRNPSTGTSSNPHQI
jgi:hypothetical protein